MFDKSCTHCGAVAEIGSNCCPDCKRLKQEYQYHTTLLSKARSEKVKAFHSAKVANLEEIFESWKTAGWKLPLSYERKKTRN